MTTITTRERRRARTRWSVAAAVVPLSLAGIAAGCSSTSTDTATNGTKAPAGTTAGGGTAGSSAPKATTPGTTASGSGSAMKGVQSLKVSVKEDGDKYTFDSPDTLETGWVDVTLDNSKGKLVHQVNIAMVKSEEDKAKVEQILKTEHPEMAAALAGAFIGGPNGVGAGESGEAIVNFDKPGLYVMLCFFQSPPDMKMHVTHGMAKWLTVKEAKTKVEAELPKAAGEIEMKEYEWLLPDNFTGKGWYKMVDKGEQPHEMGILKLAEGKTVADVKAFLSTPPGTAPSGPPPFSEDGGGIGAIDPAHPAYIKLDLKPGKYVFVCFLPDAPPPAHDLQPHFVHGMIKEVTIK